MHAIPSLKPPPSEFHAELLDCLREVLGSGSAMVFIQEDMTAFAQELNQHGIFQGTQAESVSVNTTSTQMIYAEALLRAPLWLGRRKALDEDAGDFDLEVGLMAVIRLQGPTAKPGESLSVELSRVGSVRDNSEATRLNVVQFRHHGESNVIVLTHVDDLRRHLVKELTSLMEKTGDRSKDFHKSVENLLAELEP